MSATGQHDDASPANRLGIGLAAVGRPAYINAGRADDLRDGRSSAQVHENLAATGRSCYG